MYSRYDKSNREDYYEQFTFPKNLSELKQWYSVLEPNSDDSGMKPGNGVSKLWNTGHTIRFRNIEFGSSKKNVFEEKGKPRFLRLGGISGGKKHEIVFYKELQSEQKLISQFHFLDDLFFYGCQTFRYLPRDKFSIINEMLLEKYVNPRANDSPVIQPEFYRTTMERQKRDNSMENGSEKIWGGSAEKNIDGFIDKFNNQLRIVDNVFLNLIYLSGDERYKELAEEFSSSPPYEKKTVRRSFFSEIYSLL